MILSRKTALVGAVISILGCHDPARRLPGQLDAMRETLLQPSHCAHRTCGIQQRHRQEAILDIVNKARHTIIVENNFSGQFARYLRSETSFVPDGHIRKYDGEPFMPHHIVESVKEQLAGSTSLSIPTHEIMV